MAQHAQPWALSRNPVGIQRWNYSAYESSSSASQDQFLAFAPEFIMSLGPATDFLPGLVNPGLGDRRGAAQGHLRSQTFAYPIEARDASLEHARVREHSLRLRRANWLKRPGDGGGLLHL